MSRCATRLAVLVGTSRLRGQPLTQCTWPTWDGWPWGCFDYKLQPLSQKSAEIVQLHLPVFVGETRRTMTSDLRRGSADDTEMLPGPHTRTSQTSGVRKITACVACRRLKVSRQADTLHGLEPMIARSNATCPARGLPHAPDAARGELDVP